MIIKIVFVCFLKWSLKSFSFVLISLIKIVCHFTFDCCFALLLLNQNCWTKTAAAKKLLIAKLRKTDIVSRVTCHSRVKSVFAWLTHDTFDTMWRKAFQFQRWQCPKGSKVQSSRSTLELCVFDICTTSYADSFYALCLLYLLLVTHCLPSDTPRSDTPVYHCLSLFTMFTYTVYLGRVIERF